MGREHLSSPPAAARVEGGEAGSCYCRCHRASGCNSLTLERAGWATGHSTPGCPQHAPTDMLLRRTAAAGLYLMRDLGIKLFNNRQQACDFSCRLSRWDQRGQWQVFTCRAVHHRHVRDRGPLGKRRRRPRLRARRQSSCS